MAINPILAQPKTVDFQLKAPEVIEIGAGSNFDFGIDVKLPKGFHIYLKHLSTLNFNIVTEFKVDNKTGFLIALKSEPKGSKKGESIILPGQGNDKVAGSYKLSLSEIKGRAKSDEMYKVPISIKTQLCDTKKDVCLRPQEQNIILNVKIVKDKVALKSRSLAKDKINWLDDDNEAMKLAKSRGQKILVLYTADWCGPCVNLSKEILSKQEVGDYLNKNYVTFRYKDGESDDSYNSKYDIEYFPTMYLADQNMKPIKNADPSWESPKKFINSITKYAVPYNSNQVSSSTTAPSSPSRPSLNLSITGEESGQLTLAPSGNWEYIVGNSTKYSFTENRRDEHYIIMLNNSSNEWLAVPVEGKGKVLVYREDVWKDYGIVSK
ncbi:thioredoxin family protein [Leptospira sp. GIMC2001]|uniref:thioredoxin family protein n=1 Tax=Leptospira sp. GIMC2001 TaxID=1513297 RepID=UPI00234B6C74|nr:thioredoxin family protein [Leptospira sp. GIMC2001]WCL47792.1 thioredoxin family protein [Leptospira sp. GIMC2001]